MAHAVFSIAELLPIERFPVYSNARMYIKPLIQTSHLLLRKYGLSVSQVVDFEFNTISLTDLRFSKLADIAISCRQTNREDTVEVIVVMFQYLADVKEILSQSHNKERVILLGLINGDEGPPSPKLEDMLVVATTDEQLYEDIDNLLERHIFQRVRVVAEDLESLQSHRFSGHRYFLRKRKLDEASHSSNG